MLRFRRERLEESDLKGIHRDGAPREALVLWTFQNTLARDNCAGLHRAVTARKFPHQNHRRHRACKGQRASERTLALMRRETRGARARRETKACVRRKRTFAERAHRLVHLIERSPACETQNMLSVRRSSGTHAAFTKELRNSPSTLPNHLLAEVTNVVRPRVHILLGPRAPHLATTPSGGQQRSIMPTFFCVSRTSAHRVVPHRPTLFVSLEN